MLQKWKRRKRTEEEPNLPRDNSSPTDHDNNTKKRSIGILNPVVSGHYTDEVPGSVILLSKPYNGNEPLGLRHAHARTSSSSLPSPLRPPSDQSSLPKRPEKRSKGGEFILVPQPDDSANDPLNWPTVRRDAALLSLGFYCMVGGGMTPILAAGFNNVAETYNVSVPRVALTTGFYMLGLGLGSVVASPTAILWGKRPVYLVAIIIFALTSIWCALSPNYTSLLIARIVQGMAVSPVECLPSATIAEIFFLHERAYRLGIYTLLLLGGKNLIPLVSAAIIESLDWRWVFWIVAIIVGFCFFLVFFFVPETFWDRTPRPRDRTRARSRSRSRTRSRSNQRQLNPHPVRTPNRTVGFSEPPKDADDIEEKPRQDNVTPATDSYFPPHPPNDLSGQAGPSAIAPTHTESTGDVEKQQNDGDGIQSPTVSTPGESDRRSEVSVYYTNFYREAPQKSYVESLRPWNGRLAKDKWLKVMLRPFILFAYPAVLWSSMVYALAVGWLIVLSESVAHIYQDRESYNFTSLQVGLVYLSPFIGGVLGTAVAGKISDIVVRFMARRNDGIYEPEFRLTMAIPIALSTTIGLMGFGWSAEEKNAWIVPTIFFGVISFGCCLASTTAVTFVVDSYRVYAGEALVTLNFSKNVLHGFIFSLFFPHWLESDGSKDVFLAIGGIQLGCMLLSIPMYIYGKRARMWTARKNLMEKL